MIRPGSRRPFTPIDGLVLAAGLGLGGWAAAAIDPCFLRFLWVYRGVSPPWPWMPGWALGLELPVRRVQAGFTAALVPISLAVALATFRRPVGGLRRLASSPGLAGSAAVAGGLLASVGVRMLLPRWDAGQLPPPDSSYWSNLTEYARFDVTAPLSGAWAYQALGRLWHPRDDWRDWLGRWLGASWLLATAIEPFCYLAWR